VVRCQIIGDLSNPAAVQPVARQLVFTAKAIRERFEDVLRRNDTSLGTWVVLNAISEQGTVSQRMLAGHVHLDGATMTHHVDRLEALGLVRRQLDPGDRRVRRIEATAEGKRLHRRLRAELQKFEAKLFAGLDDEDRAQLRRLLDRLDENVRDL
jgi:MarR family transcriptional regulator, transcriptional regulator for hemolysin